MDEKQRLSGEILYRERVVPSFGAFVPSLLLIPALALTFAPFSWLFGLCIGIALYAASVFALVAASPLVVITDATLRVGAATISREFVGRTNAITDADEKTRAIRTELNALAYLKLQASVKEMVRVEITDPRDSVPYWLFSSRSAERVVEILAKS